MIVQPRVILCAKMGEPVNAVFVIVLLDGKKPLIVAAGILLIQTKIARERYITARRGFVNQSVKMPLALLLAINPKTPLDVIVRVAVCVFLDT